MKSRPRHHRERRARVRLLLSTLLLACASPLFAETDSVEQWTPMGGGNLAPRNLFDATTRRARWVGAAIPGASPELLEAVRPAIREKGDWSRTYALTGKSKPPVQALRCTVESPVFKLEFGALPIGMYAVRVVAMVKTEFVDTYRRPVNLEFRVNDGPGGVTNLYRHRIPYWDDFYSVTEFYWNADEVRSYSATLTVGAGSIVPLHIHNVDMHDVLAGLARKAGKTRTVLYTADERERLRAIIAPEEALRIADGNVPLDDYVRGLGDELDPAARRRRDDLLWNAVPPLNLQYVAEYDENFLYNHMQPGAVSREDFEKVHGKWETEGHPKYAWRSPCVFVNRTLGLRYTLEEFARDAPLPDPYPGKDPLGTYFPAVEGMGHAEHWMPVSTLLGLWHAWVRAPIAHYHGNDDRRFPWLYHVSGNHRAARDAALLLCRWAHLYPGFTGSQWLGYGVIAPMADKRDYRLGQNNFGGRGIMLLEGMVRSYEYLYDYIRGNDELAMAVNRYIPWVRTEADVRRLIEERVLQFGAKQYMHLIRRGDGNTPTALMRIVAVQQAPAIVAPWLDHLWTRTWIYPHPPAGVPDYLSTTTQRDGTTFIGSVFYGQGGSPFLEFVEMSRRFVAAGGDPRYDLSDPELYVKARTGCLFPLESSVAGGYPMTIGDVGDPAKPRMLDDLVRFDQNFRLGWRWFGDPRLAWILKYYLGRRVESDVEWAAVEEAAARQGRNPYLAQRSRVLADWAGILESGGEFDDFRFKRTAYLRVGMGYGHSHDDTLDLQVIALGAHMLNDVGWRGAYSMPKPSDTRVHNRVEVNGAAHPREGCWKGHAWIRTLSPQPGAQYMEGVAVPPPNQKHVRGYARAVALIDALPGAPPDAPPSTPVDLGTQTAHDPDVEIPASYVFDVQRMAGGATHTFNFHGNWSDDFSHNGAEMTPVGQSTVDPIEDPSPESRYLMKHLDGDGLKWKGSAPETLTATWRLRRAEADIRGRLPHSGTPVVRRQQNAEKLMLGADYREDAPRRYTRLHLPGRAGDKVLTGWLTPTREDYPHATWPFLMVQRADDTEDQETVYAAVIEPFLGTPFIERVRRVPVPDNDAGATAAAALEINLVDGRRDLCFSDGRDARRRIEDLDVRARFLFQSEDDQGLRLLHMVEGTACASPALMIAAKPAAYRGRLVAVDYRKRTLTVDGVWPESHLAGAQVELGNDRHRTSYTVKGSRTVEGGLALQVDKALDISYARVLRTDPAKGEVTVPIKPETMTTGNDAGLTCTTEDMRKAFRCRLAGKAEDGWTYALEEGFSAEDFPVGSLFRLWACGVGDEVVLPAFVHLEREAPGQYRLRSNANLRISQPSALAPGTDTEYSSIGIRTEGDALVVPENALPVDGLMVRLAMAATHGK